MTGHDAIPTVRVGWKAAHRIVASRFPPVGPWDRIATAADFEALAEIEGLTNPRIREELGTVSRVPRERWATGPGSTPIMAAFTHLNPEGSRFSDGSYGVLYVSRSEQTAIRETVHHRERFLRRTREPPLQVQMRRYVTRVRRQLHDIRGGYPEVHDPDDYAASRRLGGTLRGEGSNGIVYDSVRDPGGQCAGVFWPDCVAPFSQAAHYAYAWDGTRVTDVIELTGIRL